MSGNGIMRGVAGVAVGSLIALGLGTGPAAGVAEECASNAEVLLAPPYSWVDVVSSTSVRVGVGAYVSYPACPVYAYTVRVEQDGRRFTSATSPVSVTGLSPGATYTFRSTVTSAVGTSAESPSPETVTMPLNKTRIPRVAPGTVRWGQYASITVTGAPGRVVDLYDSKYGVYNGSDMPLYTMPPARRVRTLTLPASGSAVVGIKPASTRVYQARERGNYWVSQVVRVNVRSVLAVRTATRTARRAYTVAGVARPVRAGQLVSLIRVAPNGARARVGTAKVTSTGTWRAAVRFPTSGTTTLVATTLGDHVTAGGVSAKRSFWIN